MIGPEYKRKRLLGGAELLRLAKISSVNDLAVSYWLEGPQRYAVEVLNLETKRSSRVVLTSPLDVPSYAEFVEAVRSRCRV